MTSETMDAELFKALQKTAGLTNAQMARALGMTDDRSVYRYRSGETPISDRVALHVRLACAIHKGNLWTAQEILETAINGPDARTAEAGEDTEP